MNKKMVASALMGLLMLVVLLPLAQPALATQDLNTKCKKHKYDGICDFVKPTILITSPQNHSHLSGHVVTITGIATDSLSGIKKVEAALKFHNYGTVSTHAGIWSFTTQPLGSGWHTIKAKATDNAGNEKSVFVVFKIG